MAKCYIKRQRQSIKCLAVRNVEEHFERLGHWPLVALFWKGGGIPWKQIHVTNPIRGDVAINSEMCALMNRTNNIARMRPNLPLNDSLLCPLIDAVMSGMATNAFSPIGLEGIGGCLCAQSW